MAGHRLTPHTIESESALRALIGAPTELVCAKLSDRLNALTRPWIERSPWVCLATSDDSGNLDVSPRGDPAGFVRILDDVTLLLPERPGNRIADSLRNILVRPRVGLLFVIPGVGGVRCREVRRGASRPLRAARGLLLRLRPAAVASAGRDSSPAHDRAPSRAARAPRLPALRAHAVRGAIPGVDRRAAAADLG
ncbi:MAG: pyridoxamine 5'-phosphate oxidase family protein [Deltaproteobacteria bacterium]|nr:pyridoxamine 5'-phosphate oxidase family protein [Deltaproteobacteria bacterium]